MKCRNGYGKLRENGIAHLSEVKAGFMESDGSISVIRQASDGVDDGMSRRNDPRTL